MEQAELGGGLDLEIKVDVFSLSCYNPGTKKAFFSVSNFWYIIQYPSFLENANIHKYIEETSVQLMWQYCPHHVKIP